MVGVPAPRSGIVELALSASDTALAEDGSALATIDEQARRTADSSSPTPAAGQPQREAADTRERKPPESVETHTFAGDAADASQTGQEATAKGEPAAAPAAAHGRAPVTVGRPLWLRGLLATAALLVVLAVVGLGLRAGGLWGGTSGAGADEATRAQPEVAQQAATVSSAEPTDAGPSNGAPQPGPVAAASPPATPEPTPESTPEPTPEPEGLDGAVAAEEAESQVAITAEPEQPRSRSRRSGDRPVTSRGESKSEGRAPAQVEFLANEFLFVWVKVGGRELALEPRARIELRPGRHSLQLRTRADEPWVRAKTVTVESGRRYRVRMTKPSGFEIEAL